MCFKPACIHSCRIHSLVLACQPCLYGVGARHTLGLARGGTHSETFPERDAQPFVAVCKIGLQSYVK